MCLVSVQRFRFCARLVLFHHPSSPMSRTMITPGPQRGGDSRSASNRCWGPHLHIDEYLSVLTVGPPSETLPARSHGQRVADALPPLSWPVCNPADSTDTDHGHVVEPGQFGVGIVPEQAVWLADVVVVGIADPGERRQDDLCPIWARTCPMARELPK